MKLRTILIAAATAISAATVLPSCAVSRGQESVGNYADDAAITAAIKAKFADSSAVDATAITVETLHGEVLLSGFAKSMDEKATAESIARNTKGVKDVTNRIVVRA